MPSHVLAKFQKRKAKCGGNQSSIFLAIKLPTGFTCPTILLPSGNPSKTLKDNWCGSEPFCNIVPSKFVSGLILFLIPSRLGFTTPITFLILS